MGKQCQRQQRPDQLTPLSLSKKKKLRNFLYVTIGPRSNVTIRGVTNYCDWTTFFFPLLYQSLTLCYLSNDVNNTLSHCHVEWCAYWKISPQTRQLMSSSSSLQKHLLLQSCSSMKYRGKKGIWSSSSTFIRLIHIHLTNFNRRNWSTQPLRSPKSKCPPTDVMDHVFGSRYEEPGLSS